MINSIQLKALFWLAVAVWAILLFVDRQPLTASLFKPSSLVLSSMIIVVTIFEKWIWRWKLLYPWFVEIPNLIGFYKGELKSHSVNQHTGIQQDKTIIAFLAVRQTLSGIHVRLYTSESESCSLLGSFVKAPDGKQELFYTYRNEPRLEIRPQSAIHYGGVRLAIVQGADHLKGCYWTDRKTIGEMKFTRIGKETPHSFEECEALMINRLSQK